MFYKSIVESVLVFNCVVWFGACRKEDLRKLEAIVKRASKIIGERRHLRKECEDRITKKTKEILASEDHILNDYYTFMRSGRRLRSTKCRTKRYLDSFVPYSIRMYNGKPERCKEWSQHEV